jgi:hypothetical protein
MTLPENDIPDPLPDGARYVGTDATGARYDLLSDGTLAVTRDGDVTAAPRVASLSAAVAAVGEVRGWEECLYLPASSWGEAAATLYGGYE